LTGIELEEHSKRWQTFHTDGATPYDSNELPLSRAIQKGETLTNVELVIKRDTGEQRWISANAAPVRDSSGHILAGIIDFHDITTHKQSELKLIAYQGKLKSLTWELIRAGSREREQLAADLHDGVCQYLSAVNFQLSLMKEDDLSDELRARITDIQQSVKTAYRVARTLTYDLSPPVLYELGLEQAIEEHLERMRRQTGLNTRFVQSGPQLSIDMDVKRSLFRVIQELTTNVLKHADAKTLTIEVIRSKDEITLAVQDDGRGFAEKEKESEPSDTGGFGLFRIREVLQQIGGRLEIRSPQSGGAIVKLYIPLDEASPTGEGA
jgi:signal transduction histidine kinase